MWIIVESYLSYRTVICREQRLGLSTFNTSLQKILSFHLTSSYLGNNITITWETRAWSHTLIADTTVHMSWHFFESLVWLTELSATVSIVFTAQQAIGKKSHRDVKYTVQDFFFVKKACLYEYYTIIDARH